MTRDGPYIPMAHDVNEGSPVSIPLDDLQKHVLVLGDIVEERFNTVSNLIAELNDHAIPVLIIECGNTKLFRRLIVNETCFKIPTLVFSPMNPELPFAFNFLEVPDGTLAQTHVQMIADSFNISPALWDSTLPSALLEALIYAYEQKGWDVTMNRRPAEGGHPNLLELSIALDVVELEDQERQGLRLYPKDLERTIRGALVDTEHMADWGPIYGYEKGFSFHDLYNHNTILELGHIKNPDHRKLFVRLFLRTFHEYASTLGETDTLRHAIVLADAHHVLDYPADERTDLAARFMEDLLEDGAGMGECVIISDDVPEILPPPVIEYPQVIFAHRLSSPRAKTVVSSLISKIKTRRSV